jgi:quercetin dioxygenase-like cupin family protein
MKHAFAIAALVAALSPSLAATAVAQGHAGHSMFAPSELKWADVPSLPPGAKIAVLEGPMNEAKPITARLKFPANYQIPAHTHPVIEHVTVLSGTFNMGVGDKLDMSKSTALPPGGFSIMQPGTAHFAWTAEETIVQIHSTGPWGITYVNPADDPRKK